MDDRNLLVAEEAKAGGTAGAATSPDPLEPPPFSHMAMRALTLETREPAFVDFGGLNSLVFFGECCFGTATGSGC